MKIPIWQTIFASIQLLFIVRFFSSIQLKKIIFLSIYLPFAPKNSVIKPASVNT